MKEGLRTSVCIQNPLEGQRESTRIERVFKDWREKKGKKKTNKNKRSLSYLQLRLLLSVIETYIHIHTQQSTSRRWRMPFFFAAFDRHFRCSWTWSSICSSSSSSSLPFVPTTKEAMAEYSASVRHTTPHTWRLFRFPTR